MRNLITDVPGILAGNAHDTRVATGVTVVLFEEPAVAGVAILGGAPGTRDTALLEPDMTVDAVDAFVLSGGSAFGLDAAGGVQAVLRERGRGFRVGDVRVPIVPQAILFDLTNGGDKNWRREPPFFRLGIAAIEAAALDFELGTTGAGYGATTAMLKGGLGSASARLANGLTIGALVAVNAAGSATMANGPWFWAAPYERQCEFGGRGWPQPLPADALTGPTKMSRAGAATTLGIIVTDAQLTSAQAKRLASAAHDGFARALRPVHTPLDGDLVFCAGTGRQTLAHPILDLAELALAGADCMARAIARAVYEAQALPFPGALPDWKTKFGG